MSITEVISKLGLGEQHIWDVPDGGTIMVHRERRNFDYFVERLSAPSTVDNYGGTVIWCQDGVSLHDAVNAVDITIRS